jgi:hypothetical protein
VVYLDTGFLFLRKEVLIMRNYIINKLLCLQYQLRKIIGKKMARWICIWIEKIFVILFGRENYHDGV